MDNGFGIFFRVSTWPAWPFINNIKKKIKKSHIWIHPTQPFFSLSSSRCSLLTRSSLSLLSFPSPSLTLKLTTHRHTLSVWPCLCQEEKQKIKRGGVSLGLGRGSRLGWETNWMKVTPGLRKKATPRLEASIPNPICLFSTFLVLWLPNLVISYTMVVGSGDISSDLERKWVRVCAWVCSVCDLSFGIKFLTILFVFVIEFVRYNFVVV